MLFKPKLFLGKILKSGSVGCGHSWEVCCDWAICRRCSEVRENLNYDFFTRTPYVWSGKESHET